MSAAFNFILFASVLLFATGEQVTESISHQQVEKILNFLSKQEEVNRILEDRLQQQEKRVGEQEIQIRNQAAEIRAFRQVVANLETKWQHGGASNSLAKNLEEQQNNEKVGLTRTCAERRLLNPEAASGMYYIDPDGIGAGDPPIYVYCDLAAGTTAIAHDSEVTTETAHCVDPGCYSRPVNYNATLKQLRALSQLSSNCRQHIRFDCYDVPFQFDGVQQAWWNDRGGDPRYYWAGSNSSAHICQCGIDGNCVSPLVNCNCDTSISYDLKDEGYITNKDHLPVMRLNFGRTISPDSYGRHTLGKFECSGQYTGNGVPDSCEELWLIGHTLNGLYSVKRGNAVRSVYCDFGKLPGDGGMETDIGAVDVKSQSVYFSVQRNSPYTLNGTTIPYETALLNDGGAMNISSGIFTAPRSGTYFFFFEAMHAVDSIFRTHVSFHLNGSRIAHIGVNKVDAQDDIPIVLSTVVHLNVGDQFSTYLDAGGVHDDPAKMTRFNGFLLREFLQ